MGGRGREGKGGTEGGHEHICMSIQFDLVAMVTSMPACFHEAIYVL